MATLSLSWANLRVGTLIENHDDLLLVVATDDSMVTMLVVAVGSRVTTSAGVLEYWEPAAETWQHVLKFCVIVCEAP